jgi:hypothetical protein
MGRPQQSRPMRKAVGKLRTEASSMTDKNRRKLQAKKARNFWTCARPVTQIVPNKRAYNRKREKNIKNKLKTEGEE